MNHLTQFLFTQTPHTALTRAMKFRLQIVYVARRVHVSEIVDYCKGVVILIYDLVENSYASRIIVGMTSVD